MLRPDGLPGIYGVVHFKNRAVGVLPVDPDGAIWLVGQYRYPLEAYSWEIPEGGCPDTESPEETARRELREETGLSAGRLELVATAHLSNSVSDELGYVFRATELTEGADEQEGTERIVVRKVAWDEAWRMLKAGEITDSLSVIAILDEAVRRLERTEVTRVRILAGSFACVVLNAVAASEVSIARLDFANHFPGRRTGRALAGFLREREDLLVREMAARADRLGCGQVRVGLHPRLGDVISRAEMGDQRFGRGDLPGRRGLLVEIADQADADSVFVNVVRAGVAAMNALFLVGPALGDFDLTVAAAVSVADHEVISATVDSQDLAVFGVDLVVVTAGCRAVVQDDVPPGPVGLVGVDQLVGARVIQKRLEPLVQAGAADSLRAGARGPVGRPRNQIPSPTETATPSGPARPGRSRRLGGGGGVVRLS